MALLPIGPFFHCPPELFVHCTRSLSEAEAARLLMTCKVFQSYLNLVEGQRRTVLREAVESRFAPLEGLLQTSQFLLWLIKDKICKMTLANSCLRRREIDDLSGMVASFVIEDCKDRETFERAYHFLKTLPTGSILSNDIDPRAGIREDVFNLLVWDENFTKALEVAEIIQNRELNSQCTTRILSRHIEFFLLQIAPEKLEFLLDKASRVDVIPLSLKILNYHLNNQDFIEAIRFCGKRLKGRMVTVAREFISTRKVDEIDELVTHLKRKIGNLFLIDVLRVLVSSKRFEEAHKIVSSNRYLEIGSFSEYLKSTQHHEDPVILRWTLYEFSKIGRFMEAIFLFNELPPDTFVIRAMVTRHMKREGYARARSWASAIKDKKCQEVFLEALNGNLK